MRAFVAQLIDDPVHCITLGTSTTDPHGGRYHVPFDSSSLFFIHSK